MELWNCLAGITKNGIAVVAEIMICIKIKKAWGQDKIEVLIFY